jgi:hypothetical protein
VNRRLLAIVLAAIVLVALAVPLAMGRTASHRSDQAGTWLCAGSKSLPWALCVGDPLATIG